MLFFLNKWHIGNSNQFTILFLLFTSMYYYDYFGYIISVAIQSIDPF